MSEVAALTEKRQNITRDLNSTTKVSAQTSKVDNLREMEENRRIKAYVELQAKELESLRIELNMLKRKEAPALMVPPAPAIFSNESSRSPNGSQTNGVVFPPIASAQK